MQLMTTHPDRRVCAVVNAALSRHRVQATFLSCSREKGHLHALESNMLRCMRTTARRRQRISDVLKCSTAWRAHSSKFDRLTSWGDLVAIHGLCQLQSALNERGKRCVAPGSSWRRDVAQAAGGLLQDRVLEAHTTAEETLLSVVLSLVRATHAPQPVEHHCGTMHNMESSNSCVAHTCVGHNTAHRTI